MEGIEHFFEKPIPDLTEAWSAKQGYRAWPVDLNHPLSREPLVLLSTHRIAGTNAYSRSDLPPYHQRIPGSIEELYVRASIAEKLAMINQRLQALGLELFVHDGWRPVAVQSHMHDTWLPGELRASHPDMDEEEITRTVNQYWAHSPSRDEDIDPLSPPPHSTGAAIDLTLKRIDGDILEMGSYFDEFHERSHTDALESLSSAENDEARKNRRLLYWVLNEAGFMNNPSEWWHFSYGDQMWVKLLSAQQGNEVPARYSNTRPE